MAKVDDVLAALGEIAPSGLAFADDPIGLQVGDPGAEVQCAVVALDPSREAAEFATGHRAQLLLTHHPLLFHPTRRLAAGDGPSGLAFHLIQSGIACVAAHTNWDVAHGGINDTLAARLGLTEVNAFGSTPDQAQVKLVAFCPEGAVDGVIEAASQAGAGLIGAYRRCAFLSRGTGTFVPGAVASPTVGQVGRTETVDEVRVEMVLPAARMVEVAAAVRAAHPYEEPAFDFFSLVPPPGHPIGRVGPLSAATTLGEFAKSVERTLATACRTWGAADRRIERVAVVGGAGDDEWPAAREARADVLVTGEVAQHQGLAASQAGFALIEAGHYATEQPGMAALRDAMAKAMPSVEWLLFEPPPGVAGRPL
ncbi:MAG: Nif3-like dinuclear metal center hexameric protein [Fimbriimonas ginsengisoli]|uniref:GTP cyclohydrolase 1 type 2 homolog n=1 Tax=Fimbriimonas ginsengisoli TaxID=1005039 RepID=A0A931PVK4_FIMGI|nr:Nif3-like dinuclear metal center hexameric protein [Fimbriimonas ginsengisoli]